MIQIVRVAVPPVPDSDEQVVELLAKSCSEHTKVLTFTEVSNVTGCTLRARRRIKAVSRVGASFTKRMPKVAAAYG